jgi:hypothetical protein
MSAEVLTHETTQLVVNRLIVVVPSAPESQYRCELYIDGFQGFEYHLFNGESLIFIGHGDDLERLQAVAEEHLSLLNTAFNDLSSGVFCKEVA